MMKKFKQPLKPLRNLPLCQKKNYFTNKEWQNSVLKGNTKKIGSDCLPSYFQVLQKKIFRVTLFSNILYNAFNLNIVSSLPENFGWNLMVGKYKIDSFEGDVSPTTIESVYINAEEEENIYTEYESDSDTYSDYDEE